MSLGPFAPGAIYYADVPEAEVRDCECRNNPACGPRPWLILYSRQHKETGVVLAVPLYSEGRPDIASHVPHLPEHFDPGAVGSISAPGYFHLEQLRALDKTRLQLDQGPIARMKKIPLAGLRAHLMGMLDPRTLPS
jgi:mRNA-degrading endonuclease toxin of MazEF toxin-antitoxin module